MFIKLLGTPAKIKMSKQFQEKIGLCLVDK